MNYNIRYFINEEKKTVVCKLEDCSNVLICDMCREGWPGHEALLIDDTFIGKAICSEDDTFDMEIGKKIAYKRAVTNLVKAKRRALARFADGNKRFIDDLLKSADKLISKYESIIDGKDKDIERILGEETK